MNGTSDWRGYVNSSTNSTTVKFYKRVSTTDPAISASDVNLTYDATSGSIAYTLTNPVTGGAVTAESSESWLIVGDPSNSNASGTVALTCATNAAATERTATVTLTYTYNTSETVTKAVTVTQAANPDATLTIAEVRAQGTGTVKTTGVVTSVNGKTAYIQDATAAIVVYDKDANLECVVGDEITVEGTLSTYSGLLEITTPTVTVKSQDNAVAPEVMTIAQINAASAKQGWLVKIENATVSAISSQNVTIAQDENTVVVRFNSTPSGFAVNDQITLTGNIGCYTTVQIANPTDIVVSVNTEPIITVAQTAIELAAAGGNGTIVVTYDNISNVAADVAFYESDGETTATYDWVTASINSEDNLEYVVDENTTTTARTAYLKVWAYDDDLNEVYSDLITITQAGKVLDYATLPFEYDGNGTGTLPAGLTQSGLGTYNTALKMKFDTTGDYLILKINEAPGTLTFDIKGNVSGSSPQSGTFKVQTSADGETYEDLETYSTIGSSVQSKSFSNLKPSVRYIKWIYTEKSVGNVALGNIKLTECTTVEIPSSTGFATFSSTKALDFTNVETIYAYTATVDGDNITFNRIKKVPAETGVLLYGADGGAVGETYVPVFNGTGDDTTGNLFVAATTEIASLATEVGSQVNYILNVGANGVGFYYAAGNKVGAGKAYLSVAKALSAKAYIGFNPDGETTGVTSVADKSQRTESVYDLQGRRVGQPKNGLYIVNGKKVLVK